MVLGMVTGFRKSEWCQTRLTSPGQDIGRNIDGSAKGFILQDFIFENLHGVRMDNSRQASILQASVVKIRWRFQKNGDNGQILTYIANENNTVICPVKAALRIRARAIRLHIPDDLRVSFSPLKELVLYCDDSHVESHLKSLASQCYNITYKVDLTRFTCHSFRVGA